MEMISVSSFGERLKELRNERKLHQSHFADIFGISSSAVGSYERNEREPSYKLLVAFSEYYNVSLDYLLCKSDERLTVDDYCKQTTHLFDDLLNKYDIELSGYQLTEEDKRKLYDVTVGLFWDKVHISN